MRPAALSDLPAIAAIQAQSPQASAWDPLQFVCHVAVVDGVVAGFVASRAIAADEFEILNVAVHPAFRRRGVAKGLVQDAILGTRGAWFLEVRESNLGAIALYRSLGFESAGRRENYYNDP